VVVGLLDLDPAHRQRLPHRADGAEPPAAALCLAKQVDVDLDLVDLLHAADVGVPELFVRVHEGARAVDAGRRVDDLVAVHAAPPAFDLVLRPERKRLGRNARELHTVIVGTRVSAPQVLTNGPSSGMAGGRAG